MKNICQPMNSFYQDLQQKISFYFKNESLLSEALTHRSFLNENPQKNLNSNERLEFLGDSILSFWVASKIFKMFPDYPEGKLTFLKTHLIKTETLANLALNISLGKYLKMSRGEELGGGRENINLLANSFEALIGAIYLDQGYEAVSNFLEKQYQNLITTLHDIQSIRDAKSLLQEKIQAAGLPTPIYKEIATFGPDHQKTFIMGVYLGNSLLAQGQSHSKQEAEEAAAQKALEIPLEKLSKIK